ncbi:hypothetical protein CUMW_288140 [Citrus unshiu]|uniref:Uncharacterized protein n=1 Tax=Citrus unshiu TaxID=55188 RepID=A0A2H5N0L9_CITUN|nr:hypothetical protein CUMW_288140 [Citrus unshiu]
MAMFTQIQPWSLKAWLPYSQFCCGKFLVHQIIPWLYLFWLHGNFCYGATGKQLLSSIGKFCIIHIF